jgi:hypothetical protein
MLFFNGKIKGNGRKRRFISGSASFIKGGEFFRFLRWKRHHPKIGMIEAI